MNKVYSMLGIGKKAGYIKSGETGCIESIKKNKCSLIIIASDASENTKKRFINLCKRYDIKYIVFGDKFNLGKSIGKGKTATVSISSHDFAEVIISKLN